LLLTESTYRVDPNAASDRKDSSSFTVKVPAITVLPVEPATVNLFVPTVKSPPKDEVPPTDRLFVKDKEDALVAPRVAVPSLLRTIFEAVLTAPTVI